MDTVPGRGLEGINQRFKEMWVVLRKRVGGEGLLCVCIKLEHDRDGTKLGSQRGDDSD